MLTRRDALEAVRNTAPPAPDETVPVDKASGRILRVGVTADRDQPPFNRATMDGITFSRMAWEAGERTLTLEGIQAAGEPARTLNDPQRGCLRIMTGAMLPEGCDGVLEIEAVTLEGGHVRVMPDATWAPGQHVHPQGSDLTAGHTLLASGVLLTPPRIAIAVSAGCTEVTVSRRPTVRVFGTGDELVELDQPVAPYQIRPSNAYGLEAALIEADGLVAERSLLPDDPATLRTRLTTAVRHADLVLISGGVSKGLFDHIPAALAEAGVNQVFHRVAQKPGKPLWFGVHPEGAAVFGLPGNPVSTLIAFREFVTAWLRRHLGLPDEPDRLHRLTICPPTAAPLTGYAPVTLAGGEGQATPLPYHGSGHLASLAGSDGYAVIDPDADPAEEPVPVRNWADPLG